MTVLTFQPRFAPLVADATKLQTIRPPRKRPIRVGDRLSLRRWTGEPYRSKQEVLREAVCTRISAVLIIPGEFEPHVCIDNLILTDPTAERFARDDGFEDLADLIAWFSDTHALPFTGTLIGWAV